MPAADLHTLSPDFLRENASLAYEARSTFLWATQIPEPIFFNELLPYAVLDEPRENWRRILLEKFRPIASSAKTARDAMSLINAAIRSETGVIYHTARRAPNQGPLESIESGMASCTGLSILLIDALRAVGLPARIVGTHWTTMPGNHSWVEVWLPETQTWTLTEYTPPRDGLDHDEGAMTATPSTFVLVGGELPLVARPVSGAAATMSRRRSPPPHRAARAPTSAPRGT